MSNRTPTLSISDFWRWAYSDLLSNTTRSAFAEYAVAVALDVVGSPRMEWDAVDLRYRDAGIEVKSSAYVQSWPQDKPSRISFDIAPRKMAWDANTNTTIEHESPRRIADYYVFAVYMEREKTQADPLSMTQWEFYVVPTRTLDVEFGSQKSLGLSKLRDVASPVPFQSLRSCLDSVIG